MNERRSFMCNRKEIAACTEPWVTPAFESDPCEKKGG